jgi:hypothetical protein
VAALAAASMLGVATAEAPTVTPTRAISVQGVAEAPLAQGANAATATAAYRQAMAAAVADGQAKAEFLAGKVGATLGPAQTVAEDGGDITCTGGGEESNYVPYEGEQPDFGTARGAPTPLLGAAQGVAGAAKPVAPIRHRRKRAKAKAAVAGTCRLSAQVSLAYAIG